MAFGHVRETSPGKNALFLSICLPHLLSEIPSSYWISTCYAVLSISLALCDFCSSDRRFACTFLQIPPHDGHPWCSAMTFPLSGGLGTFTLKSAPMLGTLGKARVLQRTLESGLSGRLYCTIRCLPFVTRRWRRQATEVS